MYEEIAELPPVVDNGPKIKRKNIHKKIYFNEKVFNFQLPEEGIKNYMSSHFVKLLNTFFRGQIGYKDSIKSKIIGINLETMQVKCKT
jgi:hypothetical protein